jgi:hypothetical protein
MTWKKTVFERQALYDEVWSEPMTVVAKRYELSDVGLRKICVKLFIPVPPRGYWARLAAGQSPEKEPLPQSNSSTTFVRSIRVENKNGELENRLASARINEPVPKTLKELTYKSPNYLADAGIEAAYVSKAMAKLKEVDGRVSLACGAWADLSVSEGSRFRALILLDKLAFAVKAMSGVFDLKSSSENTAQYKNRRNPDKTRGSFQIHGTRYFVRIKERILQQEIVEPPPAKLSIRSKSRQAHEPDFSSMFRPKKYSFTPSGKLQLLIYRVACSYEVAKTEDTAHTIIEDKIFSLVERIESLSLTTKIEQQLHHEKQLERERKTKIWEVQKAQKDVLLQQLEAYEQMARNLDRAESLRRLAMKIQGLPNAQSKLKEEHIFHLNAMADWLDPVIAKHWPEVDDVPDKNPHLFWY